MDSCSSHTFSVLIVGGGPVGMFAATMCGMMGLTSCIMDVLPFLGGQCQALYPEKMIYDIPGFPKISAQDLISQLKTQMMPFAPHIRLGEQALALEKDGNTWCVTTDRGYVRASYIILCVGSGLFSPKKPPLENIALFEEKSVLYNVQETQIFHNKRIVIAGGGDSAVDWALTLAPHAASVHMIHRRHQFRAQEHTLQQLNNMVAEGNITLWAPYQLHKLIGQENGTLEAVEIIHFDHSTHTIPADYMLPFFGLETNLGPLKEWPIVFEEARIRTDFYTGRSSVDTIYAAGDGATYPHKHKLIATGFAEVAQIAHHIYAHAFPEKRGIIAHSTTRGVPSL